MQGKHRCLPLEIRFYRTTNLDGVLLLLAIYFAVGALAADCTGELQITVHKESAKWLVRQRSALNAL